MNDRLELVRGSGNVFRDFGYPDAEIRQAKSILAAEIVKTLEAREWSTRRAEQETAINHADFVRIRNAKIDRFSLERLIAVLAALGQEVELSIETRPRSRESVPTQTSHASA